MKLKFFNRFWPAFFWFFAISITGFSQSKTDTSVANFDAKYVNWYNLDLKKDKVPGVSVNRAYEELLKDKKTKKTIIVAVIDSGTDIEHKDLEGRIWINEKEIPDNGIDDDNNGYVDDVYGWGYLGNKEGENILNENLEYTRIYRKYDPLYKNKQESDIPDSEKEKFKTYQKAKKAYKNELEKQSATQVNIKMIENNFKECEWLISKHLRKEEFSQADLEKIKSDDPQVNAAKGFLLAMYSKGVTLEAIKEYKDYTSKYVDYYLNLDFEPRSEIIGDDIENINDRDYGNNDVDGPRSDHGTPVSGVIAAIRGNGIGIDGIAEDVRIMALRAVPQGDEYDKDIALAIRYAVDNGANIINMSFGKEYSPQKPLVDEAIKYAEANNVLMVHAAGNSAHNIDEIIHYPSRTCIDGSSVESWIEVGASSIKPDKELCAVFSNYGKQNVALFAPGVDIISLQSENKYAQVDGTSFAGPIVAGVAALVWSYYPELTAVELKEILLKSTTNLGKKKVYFPDLESEKKSKGKFSELSATGGIVNAYQALILAEKVVNDKKKK
ncbi:MAG: S8 family serine peptidase [Cytophagaceae bacterium]